MSHDPRALGRLAQLLHMPTRRKTAPGGAATPRTRAPTSGQPTASAPARRGHPTPTECPVCHHHAGFLLDVDGVAYRVLEDSADTELLADLPEDTPLTCAHCGTTLTRIAVERAAPTTAPAAASRHAPKRAGRRPHDAATATPHRRSGDGRELPVCPECGNEHNFLADIDGVAYHVLEDDNDTDLLSEATNLLCTRCHAVFTP